MKLFEEIMPLDSRVEPRKMFGYPCCFLGGNLFIGLHQDNMVIRLPEGEREKFLKLSGAKQFEPMRGRIMQEYVVPSKKMLADKKELKKWIGKSLRYVKTLPVKKKKTKKK